MKRYLVSFIFLLSFSTIGKAQDPSFSQFYANRIYLNPAFTGLENGLSFAAVSRMQWVNIDYGFRTYGASIEIQEPNVNSGLGLSLFHDTEGLAQLQTTAIGLSYAYVIPLNRHNIHIGLQARWEQKTVDWDKIVFSDQLDAVYGNIYSSTAVPVLDKTSYTDFNLGAIWRFDADLKLGKHLYRDIRSSLGFSLNHLPSLFNPNGGGESLQNLKTTTTPRLTIHGGSMIPLTFFKSTRKKISISPNIKIDLQGRHLLNFKQNLQVFTYGLYFLYEGIYIGALYQNKNIFSHHRNTNAWIFAIGTYFDVGKRNRYFVGFSYDANTTGLGTKTGGVYEITFRWTGNGNFNIFGKEPGGRKNRFLDCLNFF